MTEYYGYGPKGQKRLIKARINVPLQDHQEWCIINAIWFQQWKDFVGLREDNEEKRDKGPTPAEINNNGLLLDGSLVLKPDLILGQDYCLIPEDAYGILEHWYGGGPQIVRTSVRHYPRVYSLKYLVSKSITKNATKVKSIKKLQLPAELIAYLLDVMNNKFFLTIELYPMIVYVRRFGWIGLTEYQIASYARAPDLIHLFRIRAWIRDNEAKQMICLDDSHTFADYNIQHGDTIYIDVKEVNGWTIESLNNYLINPSSGLLSSHISGYMEPELINKETLNCAFQYGDPDVVKFVIENGGSEINEKSLNCALIGGNLELIEMAIQMGATCDASTLNVALIKTPNPVCIDHVLRIGAAVNEDSLNCAILSGDLELVKTILRRGGTRNCFSKDCVRQILNHGDPDIDEWEKEVMSAKENTWRSDLEVKEYLRVHIKKPYGLWKAQDEKKRRARQKRLLEIIC